VRLTIHAFTVSTHLISKSFPVLESIMATRISLLHSMRQKEQRQQIGDMISPLASTLIDIEKQCLIRISEAARESQNLQVALNSVVRAQKLEQSPSAAVSQEFASVLWLQKEHKFAVQFMKDLIERHYRDVKKDTTGITRKALLLSRLVCPTPMLQR
jgi:serine-protein kinase ATM